MAIILNLETATTNCSVSLSGDGVLLALKEEDTPNYSHSEKLHQYIREVLAEASLPTHELDAIAVSKGPGSYTGLRIGVSAAKGLCFSLDIPLISVSTLESMACQLKIDSGVIIPVLDARRLEVYSAVFDEQHRQVRETRAEVIDRDSFSEYSHKGATYIIGNGAEKCQTLLSHLNIVFDSTKAPSAREMCKLSEAQFRNGNFEDVAYFDPYYLKDFILQTKKKA